MKQCRRLLAGIDRSEVADHHPSRRARGGQPLMQLGIGETGRRFDIRRQRRQYAFSRGPADDWIGRELLSHQRREHHDAIGKL